MTLLNTYAAYLLHNWAGADLQKMHIQPNTFLFMDDGYSFAVQLLFCIKQPYQAIHVGARYRHEYPYDYIGWARCERGCQEERQSDGHEDGTSGRAMQSREEVEGGPETDHDGVVAAPKLRVVQTLSSPLTFRINSGCKVVVSASVVDTFSDRDRQP